MHVTEFATADDEIITSFSFSLPSYMDIHY